MTFLGLFLLLVSSRVEIADEVYQIPAGEWRYVELGLKQKTAVVAARYDVAGGAGRVRLALMRREDLEKLRAEVPHGVIDVTQEGGQGSLAYQVRAPGDYVLVLDNEARAPAAVHLRVWLDFQRREPDVTLLSPRRQMTVIAISFAVFFAIVSFSARRLLQIVRRP